MSSHDELNKAIGSAFDGLNRELNEARFKADGYRLELENCVKQRNALLVESNKVRSILRGFDSPERKLQRIEELLK